MSYTCPTCKAVSHNPTDEAERYCARCRAFEDDGERKRFLAICEGRDLYDGNAYQAGKDAHADGVQFHQCPLHPSWSVAASSWRLGWNVAALAARRD